MTGTLTCLAAVFVALFIAWPAVAGHEGDAQFEIRADKLSIEKGRAIYKEKCYYCHDPAGVKQLDGPGLRGILKNPSLPVSGKPATPENRQEEFKKWWDSLSPTQKRNFEKKMEKQYFRNGSTLVCTKCKRSGGKYNGVGYTLRKTSTGYEHVGDCPK